MSTLGVTAFDSDENLIKGESKPISARAKVGKSIGVQVRYGGAVFVKTDYYLLSLIHEYHQPFSSMAKRILTSALFELQGNGEVSERGEYQSFSTER